MTGVTKSRCAKKLGGGKFVAGAAWWPSDSCRPRRCAEPELLLGFTDEIDEPCTCLPPKTRLKLLGFEARPIARFSVLGSFG